MNIQKTFLFLAKNIDDDQMGDEWFDNEAPVNSDAYAWWHLKTNGQWPPNTLDSISMALTKMSSYDLKTSAHKLP